MKINYRDMLYDSWQKFKKNLELVLPTIISIGFSIGLIILFAIEFAILGGFTISAFDSLWTTANKTLIVFFGIIDLIAIFLISSYTRSMEVGMTMDVAKKGKTSVKNMFFYGKKFLFKYLKTSLLMLLLFIPTLAIFLIFSLIPKVGIGIGAFFSGVYVIILTVLLFFIEPIIVSKKGSAVEMIRYSFDYSKRNMKHVLVTLGIILLVSLIIFTPLALIESLIGLGEGYFFVLLLSIFVFIRNIINIITGLVLRVFEFKAYLAKR